MPRKSHRYPRYATRYDLRAWMFKLADRVADIRAPFLHLCVHFWRHETRLPMTSRRARLAFWMNRHIVTPLENVEYAITDAAWRWTHAPGEPRDDGVGSRVGGLPWSP